jgi:hypothetical protein
MSSIWDDIDAEGGWYNYMKQMETNKKTQDAITESVIADLRSRSKVGIDKYNTTLEQNNHQNMLQHLYEELLDAAQYVKKEITNISNVQGLVKKYTDDSELGSTIRSIFGDEKTTN